MPGRSLNHCLVSSLRGPFVKKAFDCFASPMQLGKRIMATPGHVLDGITNHCALQPLNASVLATFKTLPCILGAWFATSSRWVTMCNLPVGIAAFLKAMHDFNLDSTFGAAQPASQPQGCYDSTDPVCSPLPKDMFGSSKQAFNELHGSEPAQKHGGSKVGAAQPCCKSVSNMGHTSSVFGL